MADRAVGNAARIHMQANAYRGHLGEAREKLPGSIGIRGVS